MIQSSNIQLFLAAAHEISPGTLEFSIQHSGGAGQAGQRPAKATPSHLQANYKPSTWEERATLKPSSSDPHATLMRPSCDPHATPMRPPSQLIANRLGTQSHTKATPKPPAYFRSPFTCSLIRPKNV